MEVILGPLAGVKNYSKYSGKKIELPCVPQIGSVIEIDDDRLEIVRVFYTIREYGTPECDVYISVRDWNTW